MKKIIFFVFMFLCSVSYTYAASVSLYAKNKEVQNNEQVKLQVLLEDLAEPVNSFEVSVSFPEELLVFKGYDTNQSITNYWITQPHLEDGMIKFSAIIPGGILGVYDPNNSTLTKLNLVNLIFQSKNTGNANISIQDSVLLKNDGLGTSITHNRNSFSVKINTANKPQDSSTEDKTPPTPFVIDVIPASVEAKTPMMITFDTSDAESGVSSYKILNNHKWEEVQSPYPVQGKLFGHYVKIRAYDGAGNFIESSVYIEAKYAWWVYLTIVFCILVASFYSRKLLK